MGLMRVVSSLAVFIFQFYVAPHAETHAREIYIIVSLLYFFGFGLMCWRVREGEYPPEEEEAKPEEKATSSLGSVFRHIVVFLKECFLSHPVYIALFISTFFSGFMTVGVYGVFFAKQIGVSVENFFVIGAWFSLAGAICHYPAGMLADRFHPVRLTLIFAIIAIPGSFLAFFYKVDLPSYILVAVLWFPVAELVGAAQGVLLIRVLPRKRFGQFSSAAGMFKQGGKMVGAFCAAAFLDYVQDYRYYLLWSGVGQVINALLIGIVYYYWRQLGGDNYVAPLRESGHESKAKGEVS
jgi:MFS-type transporter involved in bile tolerance (Atg22 family)